MSKPYSFVPFLPVKEYTKAGTEKGKINIKIETLTPLHISSGYLEEDNNLLYKQFIKLNNIPIIPGSSLKGCIRAITEAVSHSCYLESKNIDHRKFSQNKFDKNKNCIICNMFGAKGKRSKIRFGDLFLQEEDVKDKITILRIPKFQKPHPEIPLYYQNGKYKGYKFYHHGDNKILEKGKVAYEFIDKGAIFEGSIWFENMTDHQVNLLCFSLGLNGSIQPKLGYGKPAYYGSIKITTDEAKWIEAAHQYQHESNSEIQKNIHRLIEILNYENGKKTVSEWNEGTY
ncbi:MAG: hypothetical protein GX272_10780 [Epulopiscium sp.]|nr:hypothetical protein [Candidatus Epulonipiscium sp.]